MYTVMVNHGKIIAAWQLTANPEDNAPVVKELMQAGRILFHPEDENGEAFYEVLSREAVQAGQHGEVAFAGDYIKVDSEGYPYPNDMEFFVENHLQVAGQENVYEQIPVPLKAWDADCDMCEEVQFLIDHKGLSIDETSTEQRYKAPLWGTTLAAAADAVLVFYSITYDEDGAVIGADYNFVASEEFDRKYHLVDDGRDERSL